MLSMKRIYKIHLIIMKKIMGFYSLMNLNNDLYNYLFIQNFVLFLYH